jgi:hypothetical protein
VGGLAAEASALVFFVCFIAAVWVRVRKQKCTGGPSFDGMRQGGQDGSGAWVGAPKASLPSQQQEGVQLTRFTFCSVHSQGCYCNQDCGHFFSIVTLLSGGRSRWATPRLTTITNFLACVDPSHCMSCPQCVALAFTASCTSSMCCAGQGFCCRRIAKEGLFVQALSRPAG